MKLAVDLQEKKGTFGDVYYESFIKVILTPPERQVATKRRFMNISLIGDGDPDSSDTAKLLRLCNRSSLSLSDLTKGIFVKAEGNQLELLGWLESEIKSQCKIVKSNLEVVHKSYEEEI